MSESRLIDEVHVPRGPGRSLLAAFEAMDEAAIPYCVLRHYRTLPEKVPAKDVDCIVPREIAPDVLLQALARHRVNAVQDVYRAHEPHAHAYVVTHDLGRTDSLLRLDVCSGCGYNGRLFYSADELLNSRLRRGPFWVLTPDLEFICYLIRKVAQGSMADGEGRYLSELYRLDASGCRRHIERWWGEDSARFLATAAETGEWSLVRSRLSSLRSKLLRRAALRDPLSIFSRWLHEAKRWMIRWLRPTGLLVAIVGTDGAGKSTIITEVREAWTCAFWRTDEAHYPPRLFRRGDGHPVTDPHRLPPWPLPVSVLKIIYLLAVSTLHYFLRARLQLVRSTLLLYDRYSLDVLVDPRRYRYGGPQRLARMLWRLTPKPDLVILLDVPAEIVQGRKQEVSAYETARQRDAYLTLVGNMSNGTVIDASQPPEAVVADVNRAILDHLAARTAKRVGLEFLR